MYLSEILLQEIHCELIPEYIINIAQKSFFQVTHTEGVFIILLM